MNYIRLFSIFSLVLFSCSKADLKVFEASDLMTEELRGKYIVINYWADWCPPCIREIPELNKLNNKFSKDLKVLLFNYDNLEGDELREQLKRFNVKVDSLEEDPRNIFGWDLPENLPVTFIIGTDGKLKHRLDGPQSYEGLVELLELI